MTDKHAAEAAPVEIAPADGQSNATAPKTIWQELDSWSQSFQPWQKFILSYAIRSGGLSDPEVEQAYALFLYNNGLAKEPEPKIEIPETITGRPDAASLSPVFLSKIGGLESVNAIPSTTELNFSDFLTVIYGRNGAGKSGFARILSNGCFSRMRYEILPNIYTKEKNLTAASAKIVLTDGEKKETPITFDASQEFADLKRISVFDTGVASKHLREKSPLNFKPAGFDVFPEMARVYQLLSEKLVANIEQNNQENRFSASFLDQESPISLFVNNLSAQTNIEELKKHATFGTVEEARLAEVQQQIKDLQSKSVADALKQHEAAKNDINALMSKIGSALASVSKDKRKSCEAAISTFLEKAKIVKEQGAESFKSKSFKNIGTPAWEGFLTAAKDFANGEHPPEYPHDDAACLFCQRPLDEPSLSLVRRYWTFLAGDARQEAETANEALNIHIEELKSLALDFFAKTTTVYAHVSRLNSTLATLIEEQIVAINDDRNTIIDILEAGTGKVPEYALEHSVAALKDLSEQLTIDIDRLKLQKVEDAIKQLEAEALLLLHKKILSKLSVEIEAYVSGLVWAQAANSKRTRLRPLPLTAKENELFDTLIAGKYKDALEEECKKLECELPVEFITQGVKGQTVRSLSIVGGHNPHEVLSEGEQRAVALADFLTEITLNPANAGIILDDPVTSQDHERKQHIANRLVQEAQGRQVIIFTHDLVFLTMLAEAAETHETELLTHWVQRDSEGRPGLVSLDDCPANTPQYRTAHKALLTLGEAKKAKGSQQEDLIRRGMGELRRTVEEIVPHYLLKQIVKRWSDRVMVTTLPKVNWDATLIKDIVSTFEETSTIFEGHSHTEEKMGAPPEVGDLEKMLARVNDLIKRAKA